MFIKRIDDAFVCLQSSTIRYDNEKRGSENHLVALVCEVCSHICLNQQTA
jgi:hypothetical protein